MTPKKTLSSKYPVRNLQHPSSTSLKDIPFLKYFLYRYPHETFRVSSMDSSKVKQDVMENLDSSLFSGTVLDTLLNDLETENLACMKRVAYINEQ